MRTPQSNDQIRVSFNITHWHITLHKPTSFKLCISILTANNCEHYQHWPILLHHFYQKWWIMWDLKFNFKDKMTQIFQIFFKTSFLMGRYVINCDNHYPVRIGNNYPVCMSHATCVTSSQSAFNQLWSQHCDALPYQLRKPQAWVSTR